MKLLIEIKVKGKKEEEERLRSRLFDAIQEVKKEALDRGCIVRSSLEDYEDNELKKFISKIIRIK